MIELEQRKPGPRTKVTPGATVAMIVALGLAVAAGYYGKDRYPPAGAAPAVPPAQPPPPQPGLAPPAAKRPPGGGPGGAVRREVLARFKRQLEQVERAFAQQLKGLREARRRLSRELAAARDDRARRALRARLATLRRQRRAIARARAKALRTLRKAMRKALRGLLPRAVSPNAKPSRWPAAGRQKTLRKADVQRGMRRIRPRVQACFNRYKVPGMASVRITIGRNGRVSRARVKGVFRGTPTGSCVKRAVKGARFPRFDGAPLNLTYPFVLR